ncbi:MAG: SDR family oxidoreductase [Acidimicrobiales bacterium]|nr:SDR family oxidoreductase [Acidimicrobiales bacterium]
MTTARGRLDQKVAVVTGAGSGIGRATAERFGAEGALVVVNDLHPDTAAATADAITAAGGEAIAVAADVTDHAQVDALIAQAVEHYGRLDVMHNNAGGAFPTPLLEIGPDEYRRQVALNLDGVWFGTVAALRVMVEQGSGVILTTSSGAGLGAEPGLAVYGACKAAVINLARNVAVEYGPMGIRANVISPGPMDTPALRAWLDTLPGGADPYEAQVPIGRLGTALDIADAAVFLASDEAAFVSGAVLAVDGAIHARLASPRT